LATLDWATAKPSEQFALKARRAPSTFSMHPRIKARNCRYKRMKNRRSPFGNGATADLSLQYDQLMSERSVLRFKPTCRLEGRHQLPEKKNSSTNIVT
jgi:hypothetical protein